MSIIHTQIKNLIIKTKDKEGNPLINRNGEPYKSVLIKIDEYPDTWLSCYIGNKLKWPAKELDMIEGNSYWLSIEIKDDGYVNFKLASRSDILELRLDKLEKKVLELSKPPVAPVKPISSPVANKDNYDDYDPSIDGEPDDEPAFDDNGNVIPF